MIIKTKEDLSFFLDADKYALGYSNKRFPGFMDFNWRYERYLRKYEYYYNNGNKFYKYYAFRHKILGLILGFSIPKNVFDAGFRLNHHGCIIVNSMSKVGRWCDIHNCVNIGTNCYIDGNGNEIQCVPKIGDRCFIAPGVKIFGDVTIGSDVSISANSVINFDVKDNCIVVANGGNRSFHEKKKRLLTISDKEFEKSFFEKYPQYAKYYKE